MRNEYKFLVPIDAAETVRRYVSRYAEYDPYALRERERAYTVRSIYLDTAHGTIYDNKLEGLRDRIKVRIRGYGIVTPDSRVTLELKRKRGNGSWKSKASAPLVDVRDWLAGDDGVMPFAPDDLAAARRFGYFARRFRLRPTALVVYDREAFVGVHDPTLRVTMDMRLRGAFTDQLLDLGGPCPVPVYTRSFILEVKFDYHFPSWIKPLLEDLGAQKQALSKYVLTVDACAARSHRSWRSPFRGSLAYRRGLHQQTSELNGVPGAAGTA